MANLSAVGVGSFPCCASQGGAHSTIANALIEEAKRSANIPHVARRLSLLRAWTFRRAPVSSRSNAQPFQHWITAPRKVLAAKKKIGAERNGALRLSMVLLTVTAARVRQRALCFPQLLGELRRDHLNLLDRR